MLEILHKMEFLLNLKHEVLNLYNVLCLSGNVPTKIKFILCTPVALKKKNTLSTLWRHVCEKYPTIKTSPHSILIIAKYLTQESSCSLHWIIPSVWRCFRNYANTSAQMTQNGWCLWGGESKPFCPSQKSRPAQHSHSGAVWQPSCLFLAEKFCCFDSHGRTVSGTWVWVALISRKVRYSGSGEGHSSFMLMR